MRTECKAEGAVTAFIISDVEPAYHDVVRGLYYAPCEEGFAKRFPAETPHLDKIYAHFARHAEEMILQAAGVQPVPWDKALEAFLRIVAGQGLDWRIAGSVALAVRGIDSRPHDIDMVVDDADVPRLGELLRDHLVEPVQASRGWIANWFGRAFLHARLEWVGGVTDSFAARSGDNRLEAVPWRGETLRVPPLAVQLEECTQRGLTERVEKIKRHLMRSG